MNELEARSLRPDELARRYQYHDDAGVRRLAEALLEALDTVEEIGDAE